MPWYIKYCAAQIIYMAKSTPPSPPLYFPLEQNNSWKSLCDGNKKRLASSGRRDQAGWGLVGVRWWLTALADCIQFKNNPRVILIFISEPAQVLWGVLSVLSETNLEPLGHSDREGGGGGSNKMPKNLCWLVFLKSLSLSCSTTHITIWNHTTPPLSRNVVVYIPPSPPLNDIFPRLTFTSPALDVLVHLCIFSLSQMRYVRNMLILTNI